MSLDMDMRMRLHTFTRTDCVKTDFAQQYPWLAQYTGVSQGNEASLNNVTI